MKNLMKSVLVVTSVLFAASASAVSYVPVQVNNVQDTITKDTVKKDVPPMVLAQNDVTYEKIETADVPQVVSSAALGKYAGYAIEEAYKGSDNTFKLVLKKDETKLTVYYNGSGEFVKEEGAANEGNIMLI